MKRVCRLCAAVLAALLLGVASGARANSIFALNLLGERVDIGDARIAALGGFVQTVDDSLGVLQYNPASLAWLKKFSFGAAGYFTSDLNQSETLEQRNNSFTFTQLLFAFPVYGDRVTAGAGLRGRYDPDGEFSVPGVTSEGDAFSDDYERGGGLFAVPFTVAVDAGNYAKVGGFFALERGKLEETWTKNFVDSDADAVSVRERVFSGHSFGAGFMSRPFQQLSIGLTYESEIDYDVDVNERYTNSTADTSSTESAAMPARMTLSTAVRLSRDFTVFAGGSLCDFRDFEGLNFPESRLAQEETAALGLEYRLGESRFPIRASVRYEQLPYTMPDGEEITKWAFTLGTGKLMKRGGGKVDLALQFANAGSVDTNVYSDRTVRFYMSITGSETWHRKRDSRLK